MDDKEQLYQERVNRFIITTNHQEPDRVPILSLVETFAIAYANSTIEECMQSLDKELEVYSKVFQDIYFDGAMLPGFNKAMKVYEALGSNSYFVAKDGTTLQHKEIATMKAEEYDDFISNPRKYLLEVMFRRQYSNLSKPYPANKEALLQAAREFAAFGKNRVTAAKYFRENYGLPVNVVGATNAPLDVIFDHMRGFVGTSTDLRRNPDKVLQAIEFFAEYNIGLMTEGVDKMEPFPWIYTATHIPTTLGAKQFGKFFWPTYKKLLMAIHAKGGKVLAYLEGNWENFYEYLQELPKSFLIGIIEHDDIFKAKKLVGDTITIAGGMPLEKLKYGTKQECLEHAKAVIDHCAPGGGFIFATNMALLSGNDINPENLKAVNEFIHDYGQYK